MHDARDRNQGIWIEHSDRLYVAAYSSVASLVVTFSGYFRKMDGTIIEWAQTVEPTSDRVVTEKNVFFGAGFLLSCVATLSTGNANRGQCYVRAQVQRGEGTPAVKLHNLIGGYVTGGFSPSFPYGKIEGALEGPGYLGSAETTDPAATQSLQYTQPTGCRRRYMGVYGVLTTTADAGNRYIRITFNVASVGAMAAGHSVAIPASKAADFVASVQGYIDTTLINDFAIFGLCQNQISGGDKVSVTVDAIKVGDQLSGICFNFEEWIEA